MFIWWKQKAEDHNDETFFLCTVSSNQQQHIFWIVDNSPLIVNAGHAIDHIKTLQSTSKWFFLFSAGVQEGCERVMGGFWQQCFVNEQQRHQKKDQLCCQMSNKGNCWLKFLQTWWGQGTSFLLVIIGDNWNEQTSKHLIDSDSHGQRCSKRHHCMTKLPPRVSKIEKIQSWPFVLILLRFR